ITSMAGCMARASAMPMPRFSRSFSARASRAEMRCAFFSRWLMTRGALGFIGPECAHVSPRRRAIRSVLRYGNHSARILWGGVSFAKRAFIGVPFQYEVSGQGGAALADGDAEARRPDGAGEIPRDGQAVRGGRRPDDE